jgi:outer membrane protein
MMTTKNPALIALFALAGPALLKSAPAAADDAAYGNSFRLGSYTLFYHTSADDLTGPYVPAGVNLKAKNIETLYASYVRTLSSRFDVEVALGWPPLTKIEGKGPATVGSVPYNGEVISTSRWLAPTVLLNYKFLSENSKFRPYIGVGVNYTVFYDRNSTAQGNAASGGPTRLSLTSSVGPAGTVGLSYNIAGHWNLYSSYSISQVRTKLTADTGGVIRTTHISFGPQALVVAVGYSF